MSDFVHLHVHTQYSLLDGLNRVDQLFGKVKELGMSSVAMTDHGVLYGAAEFWKMSKDFGVKPIIGCEVYLAPKERGLKRDVEGIKYYHLLILAKNFVGYKNLLKLVTISHLEGMYYRPRVDLELLTKYSEGLICTTACLAGPISRHVIREEFNIAEDWLTKLHGIFKENFYLELQRNGYDEKEHIEDNAIRKYDREAQEMIMHQIKVNLKLREYSDRFRIPLIATTDAHYLNEDDKDVQKILFCIKDGTTLDDPRSRDGYLGTYITSPEFMHKKFADDLTPIENTLKIADQIEEYSIAFDRVQPKFWNVPKGSTTEQELHDQTYEGAAKRYGDLTAELKERIDYELKVIHDKGYDDYFLVVSDLMKWAQDQGILMGVRGSVAGSVVAHCLDIVDLEPIKWELYFERFLNPERPSPPDIDMDIQDSRRDEVINYVKEKYGHESVAAICALGRLKTRAAIRDVSRVMGIDLRIADRLSKMVIVLFGKPYTFDKMMAADQEFKNLVESDSELIRLGEAVRKIEGLCRHVSTHACGHLITPTPIIEYVPMQLESGGTNREIVQFEFPWLEELGLMKFDFLGLRTLSIIDNCIKNIKKNQETDLTYFNIPNEDKATYELFTKGQTIGVFQFESPPMQQYLKELKAENQEDLCFMVAAYRPGPMKYIPDYIKIKHGEKKVEYLTPDLEPLVGKTNGFAIYQEQVIRIAVDLAGYSMGAADVLRRAMGKKKKEVMEKEEVKFKEGVKGRGMSQQIADGLWEYLLPFADYGFNKAHAAGYAVLAYRTAYLKAHYPLEFITALMHSDLENFDRVIVDIKEAKRMGYKVLPPNINKSDVDFTTDGKESIIFGLAAIKNVGKKICEAIIEERQKNGDFKHLDDLVYRVGTKHISKKASECLAQGGAMDEFGDRNALIKIIPQVFERIQRMEHSEEMGQADLFSSLEEDDGLKNVDKTPFPDFVPASEMERMGWEKELLGIFITTHPLDRFNWVSLHAKIDSLIKMNQMNQGDSAKSIVIFGAIKNLHTKADNKKMAVVEMEDASSKFDGVIFPKAYEKMAEKGLINEGKPLLVSGKINIRDDKKSLIIEEIEPANTLIKPKKIKLDIRGLKDENELKQLGVYLNKDAGELEVEILYGNNGGAKIMTRFVNLDNDEGIEVIRKWVRR